VPQLEPHAPQLAESIVKSTQESPQRTVFPAQLPTHELAVQLSPAAQAWPHAPQFLGSFATLVQLPPQDTCVPEQVDASGAASPASPASGCPALQLPPSQTTLVGAQSMSCPQMPTELRPQLWANRATNNERIVASTRAGTEDSRWKRMLKSPSKGRVR
jgi:hypothetical protein